MTKRYYLDQDIDACRLRGELVSLSDQEAHHLLHVMRTKVGDELTLFDGRGSEFPSVVKKLEKKVVWLEAFEPRTAQRESTTALHLGVALPKGDRQQWLCEKLVELGCASLTPLITRHGVAAPVDSAINRLERLTIEASKQCGRNTLMRIAPPLKTEAFLRLHPDMSQRLFLDPSGTQPLTASNNSNSSTWVAAIGPEGGWSEEEVNAARDAHWSVVSLGARVLRVETAAIALAARLCVD